MSLAATYPGHIVIAESPQNIKFSTCEVGNDFGECRSASVKRTADKQDLADARGSLLAAILSNPRFELSLKTLFTADVTPAGLGERIVFPFVGVIGHVLDATIDWESSDGRMLSIEATRWDSIGGAPKAQVFDGTAWKEIDDPVAGLVTAPTAPTLVSATINEDGDQVTLVFSRAVHLGLGNVFTVTGDTAGELIPTYASGTGTTTLVFDLPDTIVSGETVTMDFTQPGNGWQGTDGMDVASIADGAVTNSSTAS